MIKGITDSHLHFYDNRINNHAFLEVEDTTFLELVGDYSELPRKYLLDDYLKDTTPYSIQGVVWHEFLATDPIKEARWAKSMAEQANVDYALVAVVDFLDPQLEERLEIYDSLKKVTGIREHLGWDPENPQRRMTKRADLLTDAKWLKQLNLLEKYHFKCGLEVFTPQISDLLPIIQKHPNIGFTFAVLGWPLDLSEHGFQYWKKLIKTLSKFENVCCSISAIEVIFGMQWTLEQVRPWVLTAIELFGSERTMFGSHLPITKLSHGFRTLYAAYEAIVIDFSLPEKQALFSDVARDWFKVD